MGFEVARGVASGLELRFIIKIVLTVYFDGAGVSDLDVRECVQSLEEVGRVLTAPQQIPT